MLRSLAVLLLLTPFSATAEDQPILPLIAHGEMPGWLLRAASDGVSLTRQLGDTVTGRLPDAEPIDGGLRFASPIIGFEVRRELCRDTISGMPYPLTVTLLAPPGGTGCGGAPLDLLQGDWQVTEASGAAAPEGALLAAAGRRLSGHGGCNHFTAALEPSADGLRIGPVASTRMACPPERMAFERTFLAALTRITGFDIAMDGRLMLTENDSPLIVARR